MHPTQVQAEVSQITLPETYPARRTVLYPSGPESKIHIPNDHDGIHFGAFMHHSAHSGTELATLGTDDSREMDLVAVISLFRELLPAPLTPSLSAYQPSKSLRFRKSACLEPYQSRGIGTRLFQHILEFARTELGLGLGTVVWCDARWSTREWYLRRGMKILGGKFFKGDIEYTVMAIQI